jgi:G patch domain-containing protein 1
MQRKSASISNTAFIMTLIVDSTSPLTLALESAMLPPPSDSAGARILKRMGWRPGQGIGPRVTDKQRKRQDLELGIITDDQPDDEEASKHMYAPRDTGVVVVERRDGTHGLGYRPGLGLNETLGVESSSGSVRRLAGKHEPNPSFTMTKAHY